MKIIVLACIASALLLPGRGNSAAESPTVRTMKAPDGGIQPQAAVSPDGTVHLIYYRGKPGAGDLYYCRMPRGSLEFSQPVRVNSQSGSAVAAGTIRGGQLAVGRNGRVHVVWNGSGQALPRTSERESPLLYARLTDSGNAFEPERNLMGRTTLLDGGCTVAADSTGHVYVLWHAADGTSRSEDERRLWIARSADDGKTFSSESPALTSQKGACPCCSVRAFADRAGNVYAFYRGASERVNRDMILLSSPPGGTSFRGGAVHPWKVPT